MKIDHPTVVLLQLRDWHRPTLRLERQDSRAISGFSGGNEDDKIARLYGGNELAESAARPPLHCFSLANIRRTSLNSQVKSLGRDIGLATPASADIPPSCRPPLAENAAYGA
jgi:hypothetical protein